MCERLKVQPAELGYIEREQSAGVVEEHAKPPDPAAPKPTPTPIPLPQPFDLLDPDKGLRPLSAKAKQSEAKRSLLPHDSLAPSAHHRARSPSQIRADLARGIFRGPLQSLSSEFNRGASEAVKWCAALEGNVNDRSLIVELELSKKYGVAEGSPSEPNIY